MLFLCHAKIFIDFYNGFFVWHTFAKKIFPHPSVGVDDDDVDVDDDDVDDDVDDDEEGGERGHQREKSNNPNLKGGEKPPPGLPKPAPGPQKPPPGSPPHENDDPLASIEGITVIGPFQGINEADKDCSSILYMKV